MILESIVLGIIQGILEWLPISSQGNLVLIMVLFLGITEKEALSLSIYLHAGTLLSVIVYFYREILDISRKVPNYRLKNIGKKENRIVSFLLFTTIFTGLVGYPVFVFANTTTLLGEMFISIIGIGLIVTGLLQKLAKREGNRDVSDINFTDILLIGAMQGLSAFPGISRSGITTSCMLLRRFKSGIALKLSFLMSVPVVIGAEIGVGLITGLEVVNLFDIIAGCAASFISGLVSIHILLKVAQRINFAYFCIIIGVLALIPLFSFI